MNIDDREAAPDAPPDRSRGDRAVVIANAGSGKTWTLANTILRWALDDLRAGRPARLDELLAV
ncbi:MAG: hypothetical protein RIS86_1347, partial [Planctomycetota bacterium]